MSFVFCGRQLAYELIMSFAAQRNGLVTMAVTLERTRRENYGWNFRYNIGCRYLKFLAPNPGMWHFRINLIIFEEVEKTPSAHLTMRMLLWGHRRVPS